MNERKELAPLALAGIAALASAGGVVDEGARGLPATSPERKRGRCRDMKKKRKRRTVKESRRRNR